MLLITAPLISLLILAADSNPSFACSKARTVVEKTICGEPYLSQADRDLAAAFVKLRDGDDPPQRDSLVAGQRTWLKLRAKACLPPKDASIDEIELSDCLQSVYAERAEEFELHVDVRRLTRGANYHGDAIDLEKVLDEKRNLAAYDPIALSNAHYYHSNSYSDWGYLPQTCRELYTLTSGNWRYYLDTIGGYAQSYALTVCGFALLSAANYASSDSKT